MVRDRQTILLILFYCVLYLLCVHMCLHLLLFLSQVVLGENRYNTDVCVCTNLASFRAIKTLLINDASSIMLMLKNDLNNWICFFWRIIVRIKAQTQVWSQLSIPANQKTRLGYTGVDPPMFKSEIMYKRRKNENEELWMS